MINIVVRILSITIIALLVSCAGPNKYLKKANKKYAQGEYESAAELYKMALSKGSNKEKTNYSIAECYRQINKPTEAVDYYAQAMQAGTKEDKAPFYYAQSLKSKGQYADARQNFEKYALNGKNESFIKAAEMEVKNMDELNSILNKKTLYTVKTPLENINTEGGEFSPSLVNGELVYTATNNQYKYTANGTGFTDIYSYKYDGSTEGSGVKKSFSNDINQNKTHEACQTISPDGSYAIFVRSNDGRKKGSLETDLFIAKKVNGIFSNPEKLSISDANAWESSPFISPDGKTLYFASNKKGGFGGTDIYKADISAGPTFTNVTNLGSKINTIGNEMFPYIGPNNKFYVASDGHQGLGGLDLFEVSSLNNPVIKNLGMPINSSMDDFGIFFKDTLNGYISSNRPGGKGDDDIYAFTKAIPKPARKPVVYIDITATNIDSKTGVKSIVDNASIKINDQKANRLNEGVTNSAGMYSHQLDTSRNDYLIVSDKSGFFSKIDKFNRTGIKFTLDTATEGFVYKRYPVTIEMKKIKLKEEVVLEDIYYDYNKADIRDDAKPNIQILIDFLKTNPNVIVELGSHTDSRGNPKYNKTLSEKRAKAAAVYMESQGISATRVKPVGYGATKHIVNNAKTEEEHQKNRRTEFKVIGYNK